MFANDTVLMVDTEEGFLVIEFVNVWKSKLKVNVNERKLMRISEIKAKIH